MDNLLSILKSIGLSENQAKVYLAGLELGPTSILELARVSGVKRTTIYSVMEELLDHDYFTTLKKEGKKQYLAIDPDSLKHLIAERHETLTHNLPELRALYSLSPVKPKVIFYEGVENLKRILWQIRKEKVTYCHVDPNQQALIDLIGLDEFEKMLQYSDQHQIERRIITDKTSFAIERAKLAQYFRRYRFLPGKYRGLLTRQYIWGNKVAIIILKKEPVVVVIEDPDFAKMQKMLFDALWEISEKE